jgi:transposase
MPPERSRKQWRYTPAFKQRAVRMVRQLREETGVERGSIQRVADQLGVRHETLRLWVRQHEDARAVAEGKAKAKPDAEQIKDLEAELRELRRANDILRSASAFFAAELDRPEN